MNMRFASFVAVAAGAVFTLLAAEASADKWVDRPVTLKMLNVSADAGFGIAQQTTLTGQKFGYGANLEAAVGLPLGLEVGVRTGFRFNDEGKASRADFAGRLFDPEGAYNLGTQMMANPELRVRKDFFLDMKVLQLATELRVFLPIDGATALGGQIGVPARLHIPAIMRVDTGVFVPYVINRGAVPDYWAISVPVQVFFQVADFFFGPMTGFRFNHQGDVLPDDRKLDISAGLGAGYTVGPMDIKAQVYTSRVNDSNWSKFIAGGVGVGLKFGP